MLLVLGLTMGFAIAEDGTRIELSTDSDNWSALQAFLDAHTSVRVSDGNFPVSKCLNVKTGGELTGAGVEATTFRMAAANGEPVVGLGGANRWPSSLGYGPATDVKLRGFTMQQSDESSTNCKCLFVNDFCHDFLGANLRFTDSYYEGAVGGSNCGGCTLRNVEAFDCGNGGVAYEQSTAGLNFTCMDLLLEDFVCKGCGQGVETGNTRVLVRRGVVVEPGSGSPQLGINVGSSGYGVYQTTVEDCTVRGYESAIAVGNGIGRLAAVTIQRNDVDGGIQFAGGKTVNNVPHDDQGPDTEGSFILENTVRVNAPLGIVIGYHSGLVDNDGLYGREPLVVARNQIRFGFSDSSSQNAAVIGFFGEISALCEVYDNVIHGLTSAPSNGDVANQTAHANPTIPLMPNLLVRNNLAYTPAGQSRSFSIKRAVA